MPSFPIVDTHLHLWDPAKLRYPWLDGVPLLRKPHLLDAYNKACGSTKVEKMVFLQCECEFAHYYEEAQWVSSLAEEDPRIQGIVPWAPLEKGDAAREDIERLAQDPLVKGIRRIIQFEPDVEFCLQPRFVKGVQLCAEFGLHFEICISHVQMANTTKMVRRCPRVRFILDHIGKPDIKNHVLEPWAAEIRTLSQFPNVFCKMSGLITEADHTSWTKEDLKPYIDHVLDCFGFDRVMFGGDWPVVTQAGKYEEWVQALEWALNGCSADETRKLFRDNAIRFYRIEKGET